MRATHLRFICFAMLATAMALHWSTVGFAAEEASTDGTALSVAKESDKSSDEKPADDFDSIRGKLAQTVHVSYRGIPLHEVLQDIAFRSSLSIVTDRVEGKSGTASVNLVVNAPVKVVMRQVLNQSDEQLGYAIRDGFLLIATRERLDAIHEARVYRYGLQPSLGALPPAYPEGPYSPSPRAEELRQLLSVVEPQSWELGGGKGRVSYINGNLVVWQTPRVHEQIADLFEQLRRADEKDTREFEQAAGPTISPPVLPPTATLPLPAAPSSLDGSPK